MVRIRRDLGLNKGIEHLTMGCESKLRVISEFPLVFVNDRWSFAERCPPFATTGWQKGMSQHLVHDGNRPTFIDLPEDVNQVHRELSVIPFDDNPILVRV